MKVYVDQLSQPSRAVLIVLQKVNVPFQAVETRIAEKAHRTPEFAKINPERKLPAIVDGDFALSQSHAIFRYIIRSRYIQTSIYPINDIKQCAIIDSYLDYHYTNTRKCSIYMFYKLYPPKQGEQVQIDIVVAEREVKQVLTYIEKVYLSKQKYLCGDKLTIADISAFCEIIQLVITPYDLSQHVRLSQWLKLMMEDPEVKQHHQIFFKVAKKINPSPKL